jgi:ArsR family transcriptional regulator, arsenate/arsenite/antimonite-responsive transcriptional repressor
MTRSDLTAPQLFALLADETRLRCLTLLAHAKELCVCELIEVLHAPQPKISRHLSLLRNSGLVSDRRKGLWVYYQLNRDLPDWIEKIINSNIKTIASSEPFCSDVKRLQSKDRSAMCKDKVSP